MMDLKILATLTSTSAEADRTDVAAALEAAGYGETLREVEDACRRTGEPDSLVALDALRDKDPRRREVASALTDTLDDYREVITRIWSPRVARLRQLGKVVEIFSNPAFGRTLREKAAINLSLSEIFHHDVAAAELRVRQLPQLLPENELWRSFALGLIERSRGELTSAESLFRKAAEGFLALGQSVSWAFILLHACHARCQLGELPVSEIQAVADFLATSMRMKGGAAQAAQLRAACADRHAAAQIVGSVLFSLRCPHATNRQDWHRDRNPT